MSHTPGSTSSIEANSDFEDLGISRLSFLTDDTRYSASPAPNHHFPPKLTPPRPFGTTDAVRMEHYAKMGVVFNPVMQENLVTDDPSDIRRYITFHPTNDTVRPDAVKDDVMHKDFEEIEYRSVQTQRAKERMAEEEREAKQREARDRAAAEAPLLHISDFRLVFNFNSANEITASFNGNFSWGADHNDSDTGDHSGDHTSDHIGTPEWTKVSPNGETPAKVIIKGEFDTDRTLYLAAIDIGNSAAMYYRWVALNRPPGRKCITNCLICDAESTLWGDCLDHLTEDHQEDADTHLPLQIHYHLFNKIRHYYATTPNPKMWYTPHRVFYDRFRDRWIGDARTAAIDKVLALGVWWDGNQDPTAEQELELQGPQGQVEEVEPAHEAGDGACCDAEDDNNDESDTVTERLDHPDPVRGKRHLTERVLKVDRSRNKLWSKARYGLSDPWMIVMLVAVVILVVL